MKRVLCLFLDGVGLGADDPAVNPMAAGHFPTLETLFNGRKLLASSGRLSSDDAELVPADANLGIGGRPQSATGQATILTGLNVPARLGEHYGPRPDARVRAAIDEAGIFARLRDSGRRGYFCNAYPQGYFDAVKRGKRLLSAVPYAATAGGQQLLDYDDMLAGRALAADFTNLGWRRHLGYADVPVYTPLEAGRELWRIAQPYEFTFFEHWMTDLLGHRRQLAEAVQVLTTFDGFLAGLLEAADLSETLIIVCSDHGNVEDCSHGKHTENPALTLVLGAQRSEIAARIAALTDLAPAMLGFLGAGEGD